MSKGDKGPLELPLLRFWWCMLEALNLEYYPQVGLKKKYNDNGQRDKQHAHLLNGDQWYSQQAFRSGFPFSAVLVHARYDTSKTHNTLKATCLALHISSIVQGHILEEQSKKPENLFCCHSYIYTG